MGAFVLQFFILYIHTHLNARSLNPRDYVAKKLPFGKNKNLVFFAQAY